MKRFFETLAFLFILMLAFWIGIIGLVWVILTDFLPSSLRAGWDILSLAWKAEK